MYSCQHESAFSIFHFLPFSAMTFFLHSSLLISLKALPTAFRSTFASFPFWHFALWNLFHTCIIVRSSPNVNKSSIFFVIFNIFTIFILCFVQYASCFHKIHTYLLSSPILLFHMFRCSMLFLFHMFHFSVFHYFSTIATVSAAISYPFAQSFCPFAVYKLVLFHFYFIHEKETPFLFRSSVSDICSSSVLSQSRK